MGITQTQFTPTFNGNIGNVNIGGSKNSEAKPDIEVIGKSDFDSLAGHKPHGQVRHAGAGRAALQRTAQQAAQRQRLNRAANQQQNIQASGLNPTERLEQLEEKEPVENAFDGYCALEEEIGKRKAEDSKADCSDLEKKQDALLEQHGEPLRTALQNGRELEQTYDLLSSGWAEKVKAETTLNSLLNTTDADNKQIPKKPADIYKELVAKCDGKPEAILSAMNQVSSANGDRLRQGRPEGPKAIMQMKAANSLSLVRSVDSIVSDLRKDLSEIGYPADSLVNQSTITMKLLDIASLGKGGATKLAANIISGK